MNVLIIDDNPGIRMAVSRVLTKDFGATVFEAEDGLSALEQLDAHRVDLAILDFTMPIMSGLEVLEAIRRSARHSPLRVVMMTSVADDTTVSRLVGLGISDYLVKPITPALLRERLAPIIAAVVAAAPPRMLDLAPTSRVLIVDEDEERQRSLAAELRLCRVTSIASATAALRAHVTAPFDAAFIGRAGGVLDADSLAKKMRETSRGIYVAAVAAAEDTDARRRSSAYDAVMLPASDAAGWLRNLVPFVTPVTAARLVMAPSSSAVAAAFRAVRDAVADALGVAATLDERAPEDIRDEPRWVMAAVDLRANGAAWQIQWWCPFSFGLEAAGRRRRFDSDRISDTHIQQALTDALAAMIAPLDAAFAVAGVPPAAAPPSFRWLAGAAARVEVETEDAQASSRWLTATGLASTAHLRIAAR